MSNYTDGLWITASSDAQQEADHRQFTALRVEASEYWPVLAAAGSPGDFNNRLALVAPNLDKLVEKHASDSATFITLRGQLEEAFVNDFATVHEARFAARKTASDHPQSGWIYEGTDTNSGEMEGDPQGGSEAEYVGPCLTNYHTAPDGNGGKWGISYSVSVARGLAINQPDTPVKYWVEEQDSEWKEGADGEIADAEYHYGDGSYLFYDTEGEARAEAERMIANDKSFMKSLASKTAADYQGERSAIVNPGPSLEQVQAYLPTNYHASQDADGTIWISGIDNAGWTLDGYVIPRLGSGLIGAREIEGSGPNDPANANATFASRHTADLSDHQPQAPAIEGARPFLSGPQGHAYSNGDPVGGGWGPHDVPCRVCGLGANDPAHFFLHPTAAEDRRQRAENDSSHMVGSACRGCGQPANKSDGKVTQRDLGSPEKWHRECYQMYNRRLKTNPGTDKFTGSRRTASGEQCTVCGKPATHYVGGQEGYSASGHQVCDTHLHHFDKGESSRTATRKTAWGLDVSKFPPVPQAIVRNWNNGAPIDPALIAQATKDDVELSAPWGGTASRLGFSRQAAKTRIAGEGAYVTDAHNSAIRKEVPAGTQATSVQAYQTFMGTIVHDWHVDGIDGDGWNLGGEWTEATTSSRKTASTLKEQMEFDHVVEVKPDGSVVDAPSVFVPGLYDDELDDPSWELLDGYSGQAGYSGPIMHNSEFIGGQLERDIRSNPGYYVVLANYVSREDEDGDTEPEGWAVAYMPSPTTASRKYAWGLDVSKFPPVPQAIVRNWNNGAPIDPALIAQATKDDVEFLKGGGLNPGMVAQILAVRPELATEARLRTASWEVYSEDPNAQVLFSGSAMGWVLPSFGEWSWGIAGPVDPDYRELAPDAFDQISGSAVDEASAKREVEERLSRTKQAGAKQAGALDDWFNEDFLPSLVDSEKNGKGKGKHKKHKGAYVPCSTCDRPAFVEGWDPTRHQAANFKCSQCKTAERTFNCTKCGADVTTSHGQDKECPQCGQLYNAFGQQIAFPYGQGEDYAGERWDEDY